MNTIINLNKEMQKCMGFSVLPLEMLIGTLMVVLGVKLFLNPHTVVTVSLLVAGSLLSFIVFTKQKKKAIDATSTGLLMLFISMGNCDDIVDIARNNKENLADCYKYFSLNEDMLSLLEVSDYSLVENTDSYIVLEKEGTRCRIGVTIEDDIKYLRFDQSVKL